MSKQVPNRLMQVDDDLLEKAVAEVVLYGGKGYRLKRLRSLVRMAYSRGYCDGYRDGHTDAENGHDETYSCRLYGLRRYKKPSDLLGDES